MSQKMQPTTLEGLLVALQRKVMQIERRLTRIGGGGTPAGVISAFAGAVAPSGYLLCDGSVYDPEVYPTLYDAIGTQWGGTAAAPLLPNFKGRVPVGQDSAQAEFDTIGETGGAKTHTLTNAESPSHQHIVGFGTPGGALGVAATQEPSASTYSGWSVALAGTNGGLRAAITNSVGGGQAHNNLQPYVVVNYLIKT